MFTQCPECMTVFAIDADTLARAHGHVSCCQCGASFDSVATLCDALPEEPFDTLPVNEPAPAPPLLLEAVAHEHPPQRNLFAAPHGQATPPADGPEEAGESNAHPDREFSPFRKRRPLRARGSRGLLVGCIVLAALLAGQLGWAERASLVKNPDTAAFLRSACATLGCALPLARDVDDLQLTSRDIRRHPSVDGALLISATVHNSAPFAQPWPVIDITLSNLDDKPVAMRRFRPAEYLHDPALRKAGLAPNASAALVFEVVDPGQDAVAFRFRFL